MAEVARGGEQREGYVAAPRRPVVPAADDEEAMRDAQRVELLRERRVLLAQPVVRAAVEPDEGPGLAQRGGCGPDLAERAVGGEQGAAVVEDRTDVRCALVPRPALEHAELAGMVHPDVDRAVAALGEAPERARPRARDRAVAPVDGGQE